MKQFREWLGSLSRPGHLLLIGIIALSIAIGLVAYLSFASPKKSHNKSSTQAQPAPLNQKKDQQSTGVDAKPTEGENQKPIENVRRQPTQQETQIAIETVRQFMKDPGLSLQVDLVEEMCRGRMCSVLGENARFEVDLEAERVATLPLISESDSPSNEVNLSLSEAKRIAKNYVKEHFAGFEEMDMELERAECMDHGSFKEYEFNWRDRKSPSYVNVSVSPTTGKVVNYSSLYRKGEVSPHPKISKKKAIAIAKHAVEFEVARVKKVDLNIWYHPVDSPTAKQVLRWEVELEGKPVGLMHRGAAVIIDAHTGEVLAVYRCG